MLQDITLEASRAWIHAARAHMHDIETCRTTDRRWLWHDVTSGVSPGLLKIFLKWWSHLILDDICSCKARSHLTWHDSLSTCFKHR